VKKICYRCTYDVFFYHSVDDEACILLIQEPLTNDASHSQAHWAKQRVGDLILFLHNLLTDSLYKKSSCKVTVYYAM
jgi:hypothetical protein